MTTDDSGPPGWCAIVFSHADTNVIAHFDAVLRVAPSSGAAENYLLLYVDLQLMSTADEMSTTQFAAAWRHRQQAMCSVPPTLCKHIALELIVPLSWDLHPQCTTDDKLPQTKMQQDRRIGEQYCSYTVN